MNSISILDIPGFHIGNAEYKEAATGVTVILADHGAVTGCDVRGGAPASRENALLNPLAANDCVNAVVLSGGSAFGLASADGVMKYLEEIKQGFPTSAGVVPIVTASCIFDLAIGRADIRPDASLGYQACLNAEKNNYQDGNFGCGTGATCGKMAGGQYAMKSGIGSCAYACGNLFVGAVVAVNCAGDIYDKGKIIAGAWDAGTKSFLNCENVLYSLQNKAQPSTNTTIGCIITNAKLDKTALTKVCGMAHDGMARAVNPVHTMYDGDTLYAMASGIVSVNLNIVGTLAARCTEEAIHAAVTSAEPAYGLPSYKTVSYTKCNNNNG